ncbi:MAG: hypothetical protein R1F52_07750 [Candidatus Nitrosoabyssus spongiisocia]|nr:MAG: hypothetical protein R1F52_07750 [Nitrosopumilaceae archaeon AB1(1)]
MQDDESDTINLKTQSEIFADYLSNISVKSTPNKLGTSYVENDEYFARTFTQAPRMITNHGTLDIQNSNIDIIQILQKG